MRNCAKCGVDVMTTNLIRINPIGENGVFWCSKCVEKHEPELYRNHKEDETQIEKDLIKMLYKK